MKKYLFIYLIIMLFITACKENSIQQKKEAVEIEKYENMNPDSIKDINLIAKNLPDSADINMIVFGNAYLGDNTYSKNLPVRYFCYGFINAWVFGTTYLYGGIMTIDNLEFDTDQCHLFFYGFPRETCCWGDTDDTRQPIFGKIGNFGITGNSQNGLDSFSRQMYVPKPFFGYITSTNNPPYKVSSNDIVTYHWVPDKNNKNGVWITVHYDPGYYNHGLYKEYCWSRKIPDNGEYKLDLKHFDFVDKTIIKTKIIRGNAYYEVINNKKLLIIGGVSSSEDLLIKNN